MKRAQVQGQRCSGVNVKCPAVSAGVTTVENGRLLACLDMATTCTNMITKVVKNILY
jgi:hypothetical protein